MSVVVDTSVWVDFFAGKSIPALEDALSQGAAILPPLVVAELISGAEDRRSRENIGELLQDLVVHPTPLEHWIAVGDLRRQAAKRGLRISTPDAHIALCALERGAVLLTHDSIFQRLSSITGLRLA